MLEQEALLFKSTYTTYASFESAIKKYIVDNLSSVVDVSTTEDFDNTYTKSFKYVMQSIYNYYNGYYIMSAYQTDFERLMSITISGKLPEWKVMLDSYIQAKNQAYDKVSGQSHTISGNVSSSSSGNSKQATTPEVINSGEDFVDNYATAQQKYANTKSDVVTRIFGATNTGSAKDLWDNIKSIPDKLYKEVIGLMSKYFFDECQEQSAYPVAYLTLTRRVQDLETAELLSLVTTIDSSYILESIITTKGGDIKAPTIDLKKYIFDDMILGYNSATRNLTMNYLFKDGTSNHTDVILPQASDTTTGLMTASDYVKLAGLIDYGTGYTSTGEYYGVREDENHNLYVQVPKGEIGWASPDSGGVVKTFNTQLLESVTPVSQTDGTILAIDTDIDHKMFVKVPSYAVASATSLGGIKVGANLSITSDGTLSANGIGCHSWQFSEITVGTDMSDLIDNFDNLLVVRGTIKTASTTLNNNKTYTFFWNFADQYVFSGTSSGMTFVRETTYKSTGEVDTDYINISIIANTTSGSSYKKTFTIDCNTKLVNSVTSTTNIGNITIMYAL